MADPTTTVPTICTCGAEASKQRPTQHTASCPQRAEPATVGPTGVAALIDGGWTSYTTDPELAEMLPCTAWDVAEVVRRAIADRLRRQPWVNVLPIADAVEKDEWDV